MSYAVADALAYCGFKVRRANWVEGIYISSVKTCWGTKRITLYRAEDSSNYSPTNSDVEATDWEVVEGGSDNAIE